MSIRDEKNIKVFNYNSTNLCVTSNIRSYMIPSGSIESPSFEYMTFDEIAYINANTNGIKNGLIRFDIDKENEIYNEFRINPESILKHEEIKDILLNPTKEGINKLISVTDETVFNRIVRTFYQLEYDGADMSTQTARTIKHRIEEMNKGIISTKMNIYDEDVVKSNDETKNLKDEIEQLKAMIAQLTKANAINSTETVNNENNQEEIPVEIKKKGRRKKED